MTTHPSRHATPNRKQQPSQQISSLYHQFQSLKSKIYSSKSNKNQNSPDKKWNDAQNYYDAQSNLRESTILKYSRQFKQQLQLIKESRKQINRKEVDNINRSLFPPPSIQLEHTHQQRQQEGRFQNLFATFKEKISGERQRQHEKTDVLQTVLQNFRGSKASTEKTGRSQHKLMQTVKNSLKQYQKYQSQVMCIVLDRLNFFNKKMNCLEKIIFQCSKIIKFSKQNRRAQQLNEKVLIINLKNIENKYQAEIKELVRHYQQKISQLLQQNKTKPKYSHRQLESLQALEEQNIQIKLILHQTKKLLQTKEEIIASLQQQNLQLRKNALIKITNQKDDMSLGYSLTGRKLKVSTEKMNSSGLEKHKWQDLQQPEEQINFNSLESVKEKSFEQWDISHLEMRQNTNTKSMAGDFKEIYENQIEESQ